MSASVDKFCISKGYVLQDTKKFSGVCDVHDDYQVWLKTDVTRRVAGVKVDHKWKWWYLGVLRSFKTKQGKTVNVSTTSVRYKSGTDEVFYDDTLEERLGGKKEQLGV